MNNICFLVNGNQKIGLGHVYRCITIALEAKKRGLNIFFIVPKNKLIQEIIESYEISCYTVSKDVWNFPKDSKYVFEKYFKNVDVIILDLLEEAFFKFNFLSNYDFKIVSITSYYYSENNRFEDVSFFPGIKVLEKDFIKSKNKIVNLFSGPKYLTFRDEFCRKFIKEIKEENPVILVTMGGSDAFGVTPIVVKALLNLDIDFKAKVVLGEKAKSFNYVQKLVEKNPKISIFSKVNNMAELMHKSTIALINGGLTRYELAITGTPFIAFSVHEVQYEITEGLTSIVGGVNLGIVKNLKLKNITSSIKELILDINKRKIISENLQKVVDQKGTKRILDIIEFL